MTSPGFLTDAELKRLRDTYPELLAGQCPTCAGAKTYRYQGQDHDCDCQQQRFLQTRYLHAGIGIAYQRLGWEDLKIPDDQRGAVLDYRDNAYEYVRRGVGLILHGSVGTGKTMVANLTAKDLVKDKYDCYVTTFASAVENFTATWGDRDEKRVFAQRFMHSHVLVLDDLGREMRSSNRLPQSTFEHILRTRVQGGRPTILTTNMTAQELQGGYGANVLSMLIGQSIEIELTGKDFRPQSNVRTREEMKAGEMRPII